MDPNIQRIKEEFFLTKTHFELHPELLKDQETGRLFSQLMDVRNIKSLQAWMGAMRRSSLHYPTFRYNKAINWENILGKVERLLDGLNASQRIQAAKEFGKLGKVDMKVINYATSKHSTIFAHIDEVMESLRDPAARKAAACILHPEDERMLTKGIEDVLTHRDHFPAEIRDYVDYGKTLSIGEKEAVLLNNEYFGADRNTIEECSRILGSNAEYARWTIDRFLEQSPTVNITLDTMDSVMRFHHNSFDEEQRLKGFTIDEVTLSAMDIHDRKVEIRSTEGWNDTQEGQAAAISLSDFIYSHKEVLREKMSQYQQEVTGQIQEVAIFKKNDGSYGINATIGGKTLEDKPLTRQEYQAYLLLGSDRERQQRAMSLAAAHYHPQMVHSENAHIKFRL